MIFRRKSFVSRVFSSISINSLIFSDMARELMNPLTPTIIENITISKHIPSEYEPPKYHPRFVAKAIPIITPTAPPIRQKYAITL